MNISFAWTRAQFLDGSKTVTRRTWAPRTTATWQKAWDEGRLVHQAWDKVSFAGGKRIGWLRMTCRPYQERLRDMPESDLAEEGGLWDSLDAYIELLGGDPDLVVTVVRFERCDGPGAGEATVH